MHLNKTINVRKTHRDMKGMYESEVLGLFEKQLGEKKQRTES